MSRKKCFWVKSYMRKVKGGKRIRVKRHRVCR